MIYMKKQPRPFWNFYEKANKEQKRKKMNSPEDIWMNFTHNINKSLVLHCNITKSAHFHQLIIHR